ncbi:MAG: zinc dependent phospholipase C family protein [Negativicutes bacterium]|nr:zinc dependent phospholipase C family protein [Negativicutes bacterium]MDR3592849.1 zinc dependent phospholipase C family protein [Negativicutes bacterium]
MPQAITHYLVAWEAMEKISRPLWEKYGNYAGFGSFGPDLFYVKDVFNRWFEPELSWDAVADLQHWGGSLDLFCAMLDVVREEYDVASAAGEKLLAFAMGYYSHVITDVVFHPYVYRCSLDHWHSHQPPEHRRLHKRVEELIDLELLAFKGKGLPSPDIFRVRCDADGRGLLDGDLVMLLSECLPRIYGDRAPVLSGWPKRYGIDAPDHPVNAAYSDFAAIVGVLYGTQNSLFSPEEAEACRLPGPWRTEGLSAGLTYSVRDLYGLAVNAVQRMMAVTCDFWQTDEQDAKDFFADSGTLYLEQDWNADTGLPAAWNEEPANLAADVSRFDFGVELLATNYRRCQRG